MFCRIDSRSKKDKSITVEIRSHPFKTHFTMLQLVLFQVALFTRIYWIDPSSSCNEALSSVSQRNQ